MIHVYPTYNMLFIGIKKHFDKPRLLKRQLFQHTMSMQKSPMHGGPFIK